MSGFQSFSASGFQSFRASGFQSRAGKGNDFASVWKIDVHNKVIWAFDAGGGPRHIHALGDLIVVNITPTTEGITAINTDGTLRWTLSDSISDLISDCYVGSDGNVYATDGRNGRWIKLSGVDGSLIWAIDHADFDWFPQGIASSASSGGFLGYGVGETINENGYIVIHESTARISAGGSVVWQTRPAFAGRVFAGDGEQSGGWFLSCGERNGTGFYAKIDDDGNDVWSTDIFGGEREAAARPVHAASDGDYLFPAIDEILKVDPSDGSQIWRSDPLVADAFASGTGRLYAIDSSDVIRELTLADGALTPWSWELSDSLANVTDITYDGGHLYVAGGRTDQWPEDAS